MVMFRRDPTFTPPPWHRQGAAVSYGASLLPMNKSPLP